MACTTPNEEWTIEKVVDGHPDTEEILVFCINVENEIIKGEVSGPTTGGAKPVTGTSQPLTQLDQGFPLPPTHMTLSFTSDTAKVMLSGTTFWEGTQRKFLGRFSAFKTAVNGGTSPVEEIGDTGTGTGTQT